MAIHKPLVKTLSHAKPLTILERPDAIAAEKASREAVSKHKTLIIVGRCSVHYVGRAKSKLEPGERIVIIKEDGSLLVHRPIGYEPVNWQPPGCIFHIQAKSGELEILAVRQKPAESVRIVFDVTYLVSVSALKDAGGFTLYASEEDMHKAVLLNPSLLEDGFRPISYEKKVKPGFVDVFGIDDRGKLVVVEIKRRIAGKEAASQLAKYVKAVKDKTNKEVRGILAAPHLGKDVQRVLATLGLEFKYLDPKKCADVLSKAETKKLSEFFDITR